MRTMIGMKAIMLALMIGAVGCGGAVGAGAGGEDAGGPAIDCLPAGSVALATTEMTECLITYCESLAACGQVTAERPRCIEETNGGILLSYYACPNAPAKDH